MPVMGWGRWRLAVVLPPLRLPLSRRLQPRPLAPKFVLGGSSKRNFLHNLALRVHQLPRFDLFSGRFARGSITAMIAVSRSVVKTEATLSRASTLSMASHGKTLSYRRLASGLYQISRNSISSQRAASTAALLQPLRSQFLPADIRLSSIPTKSSRHFHVSAQKKQQGQPPKEPERSAEAETKKAESETKPEEEASKTAEQGENGEKSEGKEEGKEEGEGKEKKEDLPPPPPHGDKTPWQVFMETMNTEFQASKEWNESTKQIGAAAHQFTESESVRRAREAYDKSTGAISSTTAAAVKSTAGAIGKGASWTWDTSVMKGVRKAANVTGDAVDKATKPIRDTEAYRNVKDVIDDGSSSRYGGWVEKEERRKRRAMMEQQNGGAANQVMEEDLK